MVSAGLLVQNRDMVGPLAGNHSLLTRRHVDCSVSASSCVYRSGVRGIKRCTLITTTVMWLAVVLLFQPSIPITILFSWSLLSVLTWLHSFRANIPNLRSVIINSHVAQSENFCPVDNDCAKFGYLPREKSWGLNRHPSQKLMLPPRAGQ